MFMLTLYLKFTQHATMMQTELKQEVTKMTDKHAAECSTAVYLDVNLARSISLFDKLSIVFIYKIVIRVRAV